MRSRAAWQQRNNSAPRVASNRRICSARKAPRAVDARVWSPTPLLQGSNDGEGMVWGVRVLAAAARLTRHVVRLARVAGKRRVRKRGSQIQSCVYCEGREEPHLKWTMHQGVRLQRVRHRGVQRIPSPYEQCALNVASLGRRAFCQLSMESGHGRVVTVNVQASVTSVV